MTAFSGCAETVRRLSNNTSHHDGAWVHASPLRLTAYPGVVGYPHDAVGVVCGRGDFTRTPCPVPVGKGGNGEFITEI